MPTPQVLDQIRGQILESGRDTRYKLPAYGFVLSGLEYFRAKIHRRRHVTGKELTHSLVEFADKQFGPIAWTVLKDWGIHTTADFGYIVYNLIDIHVLLRQKSDSLSDFFDVLDMEEHFARQPPAPLDREYIKSIRGA